MNTRNADVPPEPGPGGRRVLILDGHPDPDRYRHALAVAYARGAAGEGS